MGERHDFLGFPGDAIVFEGICRRNAFAVHHHELLIEKDANVYVIQPMLPLLVYLVLESKFDVATAHFPRVYK